MFVVYSRTIHNIIDDLIVHVKYIIAVLSMNNTATKDDTLINARYILHVIYAHYWDQIMICDPQSIYIISSLDKIGIIS